MNGTLMHPASLAPRPDPSSARWIPSGTRMPQLIARQAKTTSAFLAIDTRPNYIDTTPMPATSAKWKYRAIYTKDAQRIGQWSNVAEITGRGMNLRNFQKNLVPPAASPPASNSNPATHPLRRR